MTGKDYQADGSTALLDAMRRTLDKIIGIQKYTAPEFKAKHVVFVIIMDGQENGSRDYTPDQLFCQQRIS